MNANIQSAKVLVDFCYITRTHVLGGIDVLGVDRVVEWRSVDVTRAESEDRCPQIVINVVVVVVVVVVGTPPPNTLRCSRPRA